MANNTPLYNMNGDDGEDMGCERVGHMSNEMLWKAAEQVADIDRRLSYFNEDFTREEWYYMFMSELYRRGEVQFSTTIVDHFSID